MLCGERAGRCCPSDQGYNRYWHGKGEQAGSAPRWGYPACRSLPYQYRLYPWPDGQQRPAHPPQSIKRKAQNHSDQRTILGFYMPPTGVEPVLCLQKGILSPSCLPISPQRRNPGLQSPAALWLEREPGITGVRKNYYNHTAIRNLVVLTFLLKSAAFMIQ